MVAVDYTSMLFPDSVSPETDSKGCFDSCKLKCLS